MTSLKRVSLWIILGILALSLSNCKNNDGVIFFSIDDDIMLGMRTDSAIEADPSFKILDTIQYAQAYAYLNGMKDIILNSGEVKYKDEFAWELHIIENDTTLNAFATPGGYIFVYSGLIKYLDDASSLAGVMGHEIAHADKRHSSRQLQKNLGVQLLLSVVLGEDLSTLNQVVSGLLGLKFSRKDETEADETSVIYLCPTDFEAAGASHFFEKIEAEGNATPPAFLSTHPSPDQRVENIQALAAEKNCAPEQADPLVNGMSYNQFKALLP